MAGENLTVTLIHRQTWAAGDSTWGSNGVYIFYGRVGCSSNTDPADPAYPYLYSAEAAWANPTGGPSGGPCLDITNADGDQVGDSGFVAWYEQGFGTLTGNLWDCRSFQVRMYMYVRSDIVAEPSIYAPLFWIPAQCGFQLGQKFTFAMYTTSGGTLFYEIVPSGTTLVSDVPVDTGLVNDMWTELILTVKASTDASTADGTVNVAVRNYSTGVETVLGDHTGIVTTSATGAYGAAIGFAGVLGPVADWRIYTAAPLADINAADPCCGTASVTGGSAGNVEPPTTVAWTASCDQTGTVDSVADLTDGETFA